MCRLGTQKTITSIHKSDAHGLLVLRSTTHVSTIMQDTIQSPNECMAVTTRKLPSTAKGKELKLSAYYDQELLAYLDQDNVSLCSAYGMSRVLLRQEGCTQHLTRRTASPRGTACKTL
jgi:hypothetical protein